MTRLSPAELYRVSRQAGFGPAEAVIATAVALAESGGDPTAANPSGAFGLWQHMPFWWSQFGGRDALSDPATSARAAKTTYDAQGWPAWEAYSTGAYRAYLPQARQAAMAGDQTPPAESIVDLARRAVGKAYAWGAAVGSTVAYDCSSLVAQVYSRRGISLPRTSQQQYAQSVHTDSPAPGDLVFTRGADHVGIYVGNGRVIHAMDERHGVLEGAVWQDAEYRHVQGAPTGSGSPSGQGSPVSNNMLGELWSGDPLHLGQASLADVFGPVRGLAEALIRLVKWLLDAHNWWRIGIVAAGVALVVIGLLFYSRPDDTAVARIATRMGAPV